jgi:ATP-binding cassette, subfamily B, bacterial MsbA
MENSSEIYSSKNVLKRLYLNHISPYKSRLFLAAFFMLIVAGCAAAIVKIVQPAIDQLFISKNKTLMITLPLIALVVSATKGVAEYFQNYIIKSVGQRILSDLQIKLYEHLLRSDVDYISSDSSARLISRFTNDIMLMRGSVSNLFVGVAKHFLTVIFLIIIMFQLDPILSSIIFFVFPLAIYPIQKNGRRIRKLAYSAQEELGNYTAKLDETFESIKIVKSYMAENFESMRAKKFIETIYELYQSTAKLDARTSPIMESLSGVALSVIILYGGYMTSQDKITPGALIAFMAAFVSAYRPYKSMVTFNTNLQEGIAASTRLFKVLDHRPKIEDSYSGIDIDLSKTAITFKDVVLNYGNKKALDGLNLIIKPNSHIALVGKSGEGKTSIANSILRFYEASEGEIIFGKTNIKDINLSSLRSQIALVTQDTMLFDASVAENIAYSMENADKSKIIDAAKNASAHDFIMELENGYDTIIGTKGKSLSGGQRQRLAIARAFLKNAPILILDEATSSLDPKTEQDIKDALFKLSKGRTTITITHRLNTIEHSDKIYVVKKGKILEEGTHLELISKDGEYTKLYDSQNRK